MLRVSGRIIRILTNEFWFQRRKGKHPKGCLMFDRILPDDFLTIEARLIFPSKRRPHHGEGTLEFKMQHGSLKEYVCSRYIFTNIQRTLVNQDCAISSLINSTLTESYRMILKKIIDSRQK